MAYEVDYIPVGEKGKSGDAIALRFGNLTGSRDEQTVVIIDGGFKESGEKLVDHIKKYYDTEYVDLVISTHPDEDHASGLSVVLENLSVGQLAMHRPWEHASEIKNLFKDGRITASGLEDRLERSLQHASDLEAIATNKGVPIIEPFQGITGFGGVLHILGPSQAYYEQLLTGFRSTPSPISLRGILAPARQAAVGIVRLIEDAFGIDLLNDDEDTTSAENNSSTIILFNIEDHLLLFTGDAGKTALLNAIDYAESLGRSLTQMQFLDIPHHGSKRNLSSRVLKKMNAKTAFASASVGSEKHPAKKVTNALQKFGASVFVNRDIIICHHHNAPSRGWGAAPLEPFHAKVEE